MEVSWSRDPKIALVHHWLVAMRGGERVLEALAELFPSADLFTLVCDRSKIPAELGRRHIHSSLLQRFPRSTEWYRYYLPFFPIATERLDLAGYDLILSSDAATVKGVRSGTAPHICYCHTPMRYVWQGYETYRRAAGPVGRHALQAFRKRLCRWDYEAAQRVTHFVANSRNVQERIQKCYGRESRVIYPPVDTERFNIAAADESPASETFLTVSHLVPYKRVDLLVDAFNKCRRPLTIIGDGPERSRLEHRAGANIRFLGAQPDVSVVNAMQRCRAFVFAGEEDFGIVMAEAQACGKPVLALGRGGATEIVEPGVTGILFEDQSTDGVLDALEQFDRSRFDPQQIRESALRFSRGRFLREFSEFVAQVSPFPIVGNAKSVPACEFPPRRGERRIARG
jgi:glycosyltransferase involved in cell wall biosynthesis